MPAHTHTISEEDTAYGGPYSIKGGWVQLWNCMICQAVVVETFNTHGIARRLHTEWHQS